MAKENKASQILNRIFLLQCFGPSMEPTLYTNNILITERITKRLNRFDRNDIIVAKNPSKPDEFVCKRIIGLPGDKILMQPWINWNPFNNTKSKVTTEFENYAAVDMENERAIDGQGNHINNQDSSMGMFQSKVIYVPRGHVWVEGDNIENSTDSRTYGPIPIGLIQSRVLCRIWPFNEMKSFNS